VRRRCLLIAAGLLALFAVLAVLESAAALTRVDTAIGEALVVRGNGTEITALQVLTAPGAENVRYPILVPIAGALLCFRQFRLAAFVVLPALLVAPLNRLLKDVFDRPRPSYAGTTVTAGDWSFPSGHASGAAVLAGVLLVLLWPHTAARWRSALAVAATLSAVTIGWTRLALGVHYLSDVVAGLALGAAVVLIAAVLLTGQPGRGAAHPPL